MKPYLETKFGTLYHGDCLDLLPCLPKCDLVLTDPPYEIGAKGCGLGGDRKYLKDITTAKIDSGFDFKVVEMFGDNWFCFCSLKQLVPLIKIASRNNFMLITWNKTNPTPLTNNNYLPDTEYIIHSFTKGRLFGKYRDKSRFMVTPIIKNKIDHPTVKPLGLIMKLIKLGTQSGDIVCDPYIGSGTTSVACEQLRRRWIGIELSEKYCEIAAKRIEKEAAQFDLFEDTEPIVNPEQMEMF